MRVEQGLVALDEVFNQVTIQNLQNIGVEGVIPIQLPIKELLAVAKARGYEIGGVDAREGKNLGMYWVDSQEVEETALPFFIKTVSGKDSVYILEDDFDKFKKLFFKINEYSFGEKSK